METLIIILAVIFGGLFLLTKILEGRAKPLNHEQQARMSQIIIVLVGIMLVVGAIKFFMQ